MLKQLGAALLLVALAVAGTRLLWPREEPIQLPGSTDTVTVTREVLDTVWRERVEWRERVTTDTVVLADTIFQTEVDTVAVLPGRWYLDSASVASRGDTSYYALTWLEGDSSSIRRQERIERHVTPGPLRQLATDTAGLHVDYGEAQVCSGWRVGGLELPGWLPVVGGAAGGLLLGVSVGG